MGPQKGAAYAHTKCLARYLDRERERGREAPDRDEAIKTILANSKLSDPRPRRSAIREMTAP